MEDQKQKKLDRIAPLLLPEYISKRESSLYNCLTSELAEMAGIEPTSNVSRNEYDPRFEQLLKMNPDKQFLDVGAGFRPQNYENIINLEIVPYETTDVLAVAECLPFRDGMFDYVHSAAVLEHVRDPFRCADEICRVLKPEGTAWIAVPFLQPYHGYSHHYYNMTHSGVRNLFDGKCKIIEQSIPHYFHPIYALEWFTRQYTWRLSEEDKAAFLDMKIGDIAKVAADPGSYGFAANFPEESQFELCSGSLCVARKI